MRRNCWVMKKLGELLDRLGRTHPNETRTYSTYCHWVTLSKCCRTVDEGIAIRDMRTIVQTLVEYAGRSQTPCAERAVEFCAADCSGYL